MNHSSEAAVRSQLQLFVLCGGLATRMNGICKDTPKSLLPIEGKPFLEHILDRLIDESLPEIDRIVFCVGYLGEQIEEFVRSKNWPFRFGFSNDGATLLGTGGAIREACRRFPSDFVGVLYGDSFIHYPVAAMKTLLTSETAFEGIMSVYQNRSSFDQSNAQVSGNRVIKYSKTSNADCDFIDYGISLLRWSAVQRLPAQGQCDLAKLLENLAAEGRLGAYEMRDRFYEIGSPTGYEEVKRILVEPVSSPPSNSLSDSL